MRKFLRNTLLNRVSYCSSDFSNDELIKDAVIIAPHPDDESLGCGGLILRKLSRGAKISVIYLTDGSSSHSGYSSRHTLTLIRKQEAINACGILGIIKENIYFLDFPDGLLEKYKSEAREKLSVLLEKLNPPQIFIPSSREFPPDHYISAGITIEARTKAGLQTDVYEYFIWRYYAYPYVPLLNRSKRQMKLILENSLKSLFGIKDIPYINRKTVLTDYSGIKRKALEMHETQMKKPDSADSYNTLETVADGAFLECFFGKYEFFKKM